jgi:hypothetical protein
LRKNGATLSTSSQLSKVRQSVPVDGNARVPARREGVVSDSGWAKRNPEDHIALKPDVPTVEPEVTGSFRPLGFEAMRDERTRALESVRYRMTNGARGMGPSAHLAAERRAIIGEAAVRIMRKANAPSGVGEIPKGTGSPLPVDIKAKMEPKLGADLSGVRVHTGSDSAQAATQFGARAFTVGNDIHFNAGQFAPGSKEGDKLLAHEITHVLQTQRSGVQRKAEETDGVDEAKTDISQPHEPAEQEADAKSEAVAHALHGGRHDDEDHVSDAWTPFWSGDVGGGILAA